MPLLHIVQDGVRASGPEPLSKAKGKNPASGNSANCGILRSLRSLRMTGEYD